MQIWFDGLLKRTQDMCEKLEWKYKMQIWVDGRRSAFLTLFSKVCFDGRVATSKKVLSKNTLWKIYFGKCTLENTPEIECFWNKNIKNELRRKCFQKIHFEYKYILENVLWKYTLKIFVKNTPQLGKVWFDVATSKKAFSPPHFVRRRKNCNENHFPMHFLKNTIHTDD